MLSKLASYPRQNGLALALRAEGQDVPDELLAHLSPLAWEHIGLTGDDVWRPEGLPVEGAYRALRE